jgi:hypothetical protein
MPARYEGRPENAAGQYPAAHRAQNCLVSKSPVRPDCRSKLNIVTVNKPLCFDDSLRLILLKPMVGAQGIEPWTSPV